MTRLSACSLPGPYRSATGWGTHRRISRAPVQDLRGLKHSSRFFRLCLNSGRNLR